MENLSEIYMENKGKLWKTYGKSIGHMGHIWKNLWELFGNYLKKYLGNIWENLWGVHNLKR